MGGSRFLELNDFDSNIGSLGEEISFVFLMGGLSGFSFFTRFDGSLNYVGKDFKGSWFLDWRVYLPIYSILKLCE